MNMRNLQMLDAASHVETSAVYVRPGVAYIKDGCIIYIAPPTT